MLVRFRARRIPEKGWAVFDGAFTDAPKVAPADPDHYWHARRPAEQAAADLNERWKHMPAGGCAVLDGIARHRVADPRGEVEADEVLALVVRHGRITVGRLIELLDLSSSARNRVRRRVHALAHDGLVRWSTTTFAWEPTEAGRDALVRA